MNRENIKKVRDVIAGLPAHRFNMGNWSDSKSGDYVSAADLLRNCGTAACIAGWTAAIAEPDSPDPIGWAAEDVAGPYLGLDYTVARSLFTPRGIEPEDWHLIKHAHAVRVLDHLLETGEVDWVSTRRAKKAVAS